MKLNHIMLPLSVAAVPLFSSARTVSCHIPEMEGDATVRLQTMIDSIARQATPDDTTKIMLHPGAVYHLSRSAATPVLYHVSNTTSREENPEPVKHIGILLKDMRNMVIDGCGATLLTHGEMTPWVVDRCSNITIGNLCVDAVDPSVPEMTVIDVDSATFIATVHPSSRYDLRDGRLYWQGEGWEFTDGIAQVYDTVTATTRRCPSPLVKASKVEETAPGFLKFSFPGKFSAENGHTYQMRHSLRTEVAGLISDSEQVTLVNLTLHFMGNFGIVAQTSKDLRYENLMCAPSPESGRTCAGFADFLQVSGCRGRVDITGCLFRGSHDDPINVHGTHLKVTDRGDGRTICVRYMHPQTFGFQSFFAGDTIEVVNPSTLLSVASAVVESACMVDDYTIELTLNSRLPQPALDLAEAVVENVSCTPEVSICGCRFEATPTRGLLVTTRRRVVISDNEFVRIPMAAILVADDARSWYESGPVKDLSISGNLFVDCSLPVIRIVPEISEYEGDVHAHIMIRDNTFEFTDTPGKDLFEIKAAADVTITDNEVKILE